MIAAELRRIGQALALGLRPFRDVMHLRGRATRTEFWCYLFVAQLVGAAASEALAGSQGAPLLAVLLALPLFALSARRLHDIGLPGWPGPLLVGAFLIVTLRSFEPGWYQSSAELAAGGLCALALLAVALRSSRPDGDRFGPDPRLHDRFDPRHI